MELWILATLLAALFQTGRFMLQKHLSQSTLSASGATLARFLYSAPFVVAGLGLWLGLTGTTLPALPAPFWVYGIAGGLTQILATICVVTLFASRNFAVGITFKKTEVLQTVLVGMIVLGEGVSGWGFVAIVLGLGGVLILSKPQSGPGAGSSGFSNRAVLLGLASGLMFAVSGVSYRGASLMLESDQPLLRAAITLAAVTTMLTLGMVLWMAWRERAELIRVCLAWRKAIWVGMTSMAGSFCWFTAFTLQNAAYVNALGQIELLFSLAASALEFREKITRRELAGIAVLTSGLLVLVLLG